MYQNLYINSILFYNDPPPSASIIDSSIDTARISLKSSDTETVNSILHKLTKESQISADIESSIPTGIALKPEIVSHKYLIAANVLLLLYIYIYIYLSYHILNIIIKCILILNTLHVVCRDLEDK